MHAHRPVTWISRKNVAAMWDWAGLAFPLETGGILMGYWTSDRMSVVITDIIGPGAAARLGTRGFRPDSESQLAEIDRIYTGSGRVITYLGDWHTHPSGPQALSLTDLRTLHRIATDPAARAPHVLMGLLVGPPGDSQKPAFWSLLPRWESQSWFRWPARLECRVGEWCFDPVQ